LSGSHFKATGFTGGYLLKVFGQFYFSIRVNPVMRYDTLSLQVTIGDDLSLW